ncbi:MAG: hypothetical protein H0T88_06490 [Lysobacter sp.]|nr:hypothetical protein [Lysobacter sp.]
MIQFRWATRLLLIATMFAASASAAAQSLPVQVYTSGNTATIQVVTGGLNSTEVLISFEEAFNLNAASLGVSAELVSLSDPLLLARLPDPLNTQLDSALPLLITIEPPAGAGLAFNRTARVEVHTHALPYTVGSSYRLLKAPLNGGFRDITDEISPGSVRARGTTGGFSQFLIVTDVRASDAVVAEKISWLRARVALLSPLERSAFDSHLDAAEAALAAGNYADAIAAVDSIRARAAERAGTTLTQQWRATRDVDNEAGEILAGAATLEFSIVYLRDFGD